MNDMNDGTQTDQRNDTKPAAFCQNCGKPLSDETKRVVGPAVFCEPCLAAKLAGAAGIPAGAAAGYVPVNYGVGGTWPPVGAVPDAGPNPVLAGILGFIPGVGAMYNGQYVKGILHLIVFATLVTLASDVNGVFGLFIAGWEFYMAIEAHHTAKARRDGTSLPNPFGLNDIGERLGFGRAWPSGATPPAAGMGVASEAAPVAAAWGAPEQGSPVDAAGYSAAYQQNWGQVPYAATAYATAAQGTYVAPLADPMATTPVNRFPAGAVWLIALGTFFLLATTGIFSGFRSEGMVGFLLIGVGTWMFFRRMTEAGAPLTGDGSPAYTMRIFRAIRGAVWPILVGVLFLLNSYTSLTWHRSWPLFIIVAGVVTLLERTAYNSAAAAAFASAPAMGGTHFSETVAHDMRAGSATKHDDENAKGGN